MLGGGRSARTRYRPDPWRVPQGATVGARPTPPARGGGAAGGRSARTRYRPDPWRVPEWTTVVAGLTALAGVGVAASIGVSHFDPPASPVEVPLLPLLPAVCVLVAALKHAIEQSKQRPLSNL